MTSNVSILSIVGSHDSTCGYCGPPGERSSTRSSYSAGVTAFSLTCSNYQQMIDRGWRRSGDYCYKPDMKRTCCPQYTIKLDALEFSPTKKQRKVVYRWNRYVLDGVGEHDDDDLEMNGARSKAKNSNKASPFRLIDAIHASESAFAPSEPTPRRKFEVILEPASYTKEKFELYCHYQHNIHKEERERSSTGFKQFLVESPLEYTPITYEKDAPAHLPENYGSYHQLYRLDGELIAMAVLDILPSCVSSVYFMYNNNWERFSLGKLSALREAALAQEIHQYGAKDMKYLYMGYYIHSCQKMRYKGEYSPSSLLDPEEYSWHSLKECIPLLEANRYACFTHPDHCLKGHEIPPESPPDISDEDLSQIIVFSRTMGTVPLTSTNILENERLRVLFLRAIEGLGVELSKEVVLTV